MPVTPPPSRSRRITPSAPRFAPTYDQSKIQKQRKSARTATKISNRAKSKQPAIIDQTDELTATPLSLIDESEFEHLPQIAPPSSHHTDNIGSSRPPPPSLIPMTPRKPIVGAKSSTEAFVANTPGTVTPRKRSARDVTANIDIVAEASGTTRKRLTKFDSNPLFVSASKKNKKGSKQTEVKVFVDAADVPLTMADPGSDVFVADKAEAVDQDKTRKELVVNEWDTHTGSEPESEDEEDMAKNQEMMDAIHNDEGVVYVFRGKKFLRRFDDPMTASARPAFNDGAILQRQAGMPISHTFRKQPYTPRVLDYAEAGGPVLPTSGATATNASSTSANAATGNNNVGIVRGIDYSRRPFDLSDQDSDVFGHPKPPLTRPASDHGATNEHDDVDMTDPESTDQGQSQASHSIDHEMSDHVVNREGRSLLETPSANTRSKTRIQDTSPFASWVRTKSTASSLASGGKAKDNAKNDDSS